MRAIVCFVIAVLAATSIAAAQDASTAPRVGFLLMGNPETTTHLRGAFLGGLRDAGYVDGRNIIVDFRYAGADVSRFPSMADELVRSKVAAILTASTPAIVAAKAATSTTPIVFATLGDPVGRGFAQSQARPGGNITGITIFTHELAGKRLELLREIFPTAVRVAALQISISNEQAIPFETRAAQTAADAVGLTMRPFDASQPDEFERAFGEISQWQAHAVLVPAEAIFNSNRQRLIDLALRHSLPLVCPYPEMAEAGCLFSYGIELLDNFRRAAGYVDKILRGINPAELPIENPTRFQTIVNLKTARALGLTIPPPILVRADKLIQ